MRIERVIRLALCAAVAAGLLPCLAGEGFVRLDNPGFEAANPSQGWRVPKAWRIEDGGVRLADANGLEVDFAGLGYAFVRLAE